MLKKIIYTLYGLGISGFFLSASVVHATDKPWDREEWILSLENSKASENRLQAWYQLIKKGDVVSKKESSKSYPHYQKSLINELLRVFSWRAIDEGSLLAYRYFCNDLLCYRQDDLAVLSLRQYAHLPDWQYYGGVSGLEYLGPVQQEIRTKWEREEKSATVVPLSHSWIPVEEEFHKDEVYWNGRRQIIDRMPPLPGRWFGNSESQTWRQIVESHIRVNLVPWIRKGAMTAAQEGLDLYIDPVSVVKRWQKEPDYQAMLKASSPLSSSVKVTSAKEMHTVASVSLSLSKQDTDDEEECEEKIRLRRVSDERTSY